MSFDKTHEGTYSLNMDYYPPPSASKQASAPVGPSLPQKKPQNSQQQKRATNQQQNGRMGTAARPNLLKGAVSVNTDCSSVVQQSHEVHSANFASTLRGNYISLLDKKNQAAARAAKGPA